MIGNVLANIAIPWFVLQTTGSAAQTGIADFFAILPVILAGFLGGTFIDRLGYKRTSLLADLASGLTVALIPLLYFTVGLGFWPLMALVFFGALFDAPGGTARAALVPELAAQAGVPIERATSASQAIERSSRLVGAPLAGLLIAVMGTASVLWIDALSFFISTALVALLIAAPRARRERHVRARACGCCGTPAARPKDAPRGRYLDELLDGLRFMRRDTLILAIVITVMVTNFLDAAFGGVILPVYVSQVFGSALILGLIVAANGGGAVAGAVLYGAIGHRLPRHATFVLMFVLTTLHFWVFAFRLPFPLILAATFIAGVGAGPLNPIIGVVAYERIPSDMRGRVFGTLTAGAWVAMPLCTLLAGLLTDRFGVGPLLISIAIAYLAATLSMAVFPGMHEMDRRAGAPQAEGTGEARGAGSNT
jgi:MFS family permease